MRKLAAMLDGAVNPRENRFERDREGRVAFAAPEPGRARRVAERHDQQAVGDAIRELVVEDADGGTLPAFDRDHPVEQVADQTELHGQRGKDPALPSAPEDQPVEPLGIFVAHVPHKCVHTRLKGQRVALVFRRKCLDERAVLLQDL